MGLHALITIGDVKNGRLEKHLIFEHTACASVVPCGTRDVGTRSTVHHTDGRSSPITTSFGDRRGDFGVPVGIVLDGTRE